MVLNWLALAKIMSTSWSGTTSKRKARRQKPQHRLGGVAIIEGLESRRVLSPMITGVETTPGTFAASGTTVPVTSTTTLTDNGTITGATVSLGPTYQQGEDVLSFTNTPNITGNFNAATGTLTLSGNDTAADYQAALRSVMYQDIAANPTPNIRRFTIDASDGSGTSTDSYRYLNSSSLISNVETGAQNYVTGSGTTPVTNTLTLGNTTSGTISGATAQINANYTAGQDSLAFTNTPNITGNFNPATGTLTLSGTDTVADYQAALRSITYANSSNNPTAGVRRVAFTVDGATSPSFTVNRYFSVGSGSSGSNNGLNISNVETTTGIFTPSGAAQPITSTTTLNDPSNATVTGATVALGPTYRPGEDILTFANTPNITGNFNSSTGTLTLSGNDTAADYQAALRSVMYQDTSANPTPNIRRFTINATDSAGTTANSYRYINSSSPISNVETGAQNYATGSGATPISNSLTVANTANGTISGATVKVDANYVNGEDVLGFTNTPNITGTFDPSTGTLTLSGNDTVAAYQAALRSITYDDTSSTPTTGIRRLAVSVDGATGANFVAYRYYDVT